MCCESLQIKSEVEIVQEDDNTSEEREREKPLKKCLSFHGFVIIIIPVQLYHIVQTSEICIYII